MGVRSRERLFQGGLVGVKSWVGRKGTNHKDRIITREEAGDVGRSSKDRAQEFRLYSNSNVSR